MKETSAVTETVTITRIGHKGDGVAETTSGEVFVSLTLPGEVVEIEREGDRGRLVRIVAPSADRVAPPCPHVGHCGGCALQHMAAPAYAAFKRQLVVDALAARHLTAEVGTAWVGEARSRRRAVIAVQHQPGGIVAGFRERLSHNVVPIPECHLLDPDIRAFLPKIPRLLAPFTFGKKGATVTVIASRTGLDLSIADAELPPERRQEVIAKALESGLARLSLGPDIIVEAKEPIVSFGDIDVALPPGGFLQAVEAAEEVMAGHVLAAVKGRKHVADLFSGCGTFALRIARDARVHAVEAEKTSLVALDKAWRFAKGLKPVSHEVRDLYRRPLQPMDVKDYDAVVFDPPRDGAAPQAKELAKASVPTIVAVSCNPATLARDLAYLVEAGYAIEKVEVIDQFLWSHHVEAVAVLKRRADAPILDKKKAHLKKWKLR
jgi:23S rRNA (uracil1939-C5)-methyltransferase